jgi:hypothetical protein
MARAAVSAASALLFSVQAVSAGAAHAAAGALGPSFGQGGRTTI